ncbi:MAG: phage protease [Deltaproteobacteria bacterium]|nr:phage protease [Deltaproteobacteria bacterium]
MNNLQVIISKEILLNPPLEKGELKGVVPAEIQVIPYGFHSTAKGDFVCDEASAKKVIGTFDAKTNDMVIDYEHQTLQGTEAPAAGWIKELVNKGRDGIWAVVEWTDRAKEYIKNKEYRYVSPVFLKRLSDNKVMALINVALTNQPNIDGMVPLVNKELKTKKEEQQMNRLLEALGLAADATEDEAIAAIVKLKEAAGVTACKAVMDSLGLKEGAAESEVVGTIMAMKQSHGQTGDLSQKVKDLSDKLAARDAQELVALAMKEGKITAAQKPWADEYAKRDPEGFKVFVAKASVVVPVGEIAGPGVKGQGSGEVDETQLQINKALGVSEETFRKYQKQVV